jgi:NADH:ubiquinone oxidoreductase subunit 6 (subunit J)
MDTISQNVLVVTAAVVASLLFMLALNRVWPAEERRSHNDLIGWQLSILSTTYAVILGFMLYTVWTTYGQADLNVDLEANSVADLYRLAEEFPEPQRSQLKNLARSYAEAVINREWPEMANNVEPTEGVAIISEMWRTLKSVPATSPTGQMAEDHAFTELNSLAQHRLTRLTQSTMRLPNVLWGVLLVGGVLTIVSACMFALQEEKLQALQIFALSLLVSLSLVAIADIHRPFQGLIHVRDYAFQRVLESMKDS